MLYFTQALKKARAKQSEVLAEIARNDLVLRFFITHTIDGAYFDVRGKIKTKLQKRSEHLGRKIQFYEQVKDFINYFHQIL